MSGGRGLPDPNADPPGRNNCRHPGSNYQTRPHPCRYSERSPNRHTLKELSIVRTILHGPDCNHYDCTGGAGRFCARRPSDFCTCPQQGCRLADGSSRPGSPSPRSPGFDAPALSQRPSPSSPENGIAAPAGKDHQEHRNSHCRPAHDASRCPQADPCRSWPRSRTQDSQSNGRRPESPRQQVPLCGHAPPGSCAPPARAGSRRLYACRRRRSIRRHYGRDQLAPVWIRVNDRDHALRIGRC
jgi:hypothetical protein